jgi:DNA repair protein RadA/Sms
LLLSILFRTFTHTDYIESTAGSISQIRETTAELIKVCQGNQYSVILIGHITKDGTIAGPKILEHMVDTVLQFEGDQKSCLPNSTFPKKNRFGSTAEIGIYEMLGSGLREVSNLPKYFLTRTKSYQEQHCINTRRHAPLMLEIQH